MWEQLLLLSSSSWLCIFSWKEKKEKRKQNSGPSLKQQWRQGMDVSSAERRRHTHIGGGGVRAFIHRSGEKILKSGVLSSSPLAFKVIASYIFQNAVALNLKGFHCEKEATSLDWMGLVCRNIWRATVNHLPKLFSFDIISFSLLFWPSYANFSRSFHRRVDTNFSNRKWSVSAALLTNWKRLKFEERQWSKEEEGNCNTSWDTAHKLRVMILFSNYRRDCAISNNKHWIGKRSGSELTTLTPGFITGHFGSSR
jgi:hypothetical protein